MTSSVTTAPGPWAHRDLCRSFCYHGVAAIAMLVVLAAYPGPAAGDLTSADQLSRGMFDSRSFPFSHVVIDNLTGTVFAGAVNRLYQFPPDLGVDGRREVVTGPLDDNPVCPPQPEECKCTMTGCTNPERRPMNGVSKVLLIDYDNRQLIHCTNLYQVRHSHASRDLIDQQHFCATRFLFADQFPLRSG